MRPPVLDKGGFCMPEIQFRNAVESDLPDILALYRTLDEAMVELQPEFFCAAPRSSAPLRGAAQKSAGVTSPIASSSVRYSA